MLRKLKYLSAYFNKEETMGPLVVYRRKDGGSALASAFNYYINVPFSYVAILDEYDAELQYWPVTNPTDYI